MSTRRYLGNPVVALAYLVGPGMSALFGLWGTSSESVTRLGHRLLLKMV